MLSCLSTRPLAVALFLCLSLAAIAAPFTPATDLEVVERLPSGASDPSVRRVESLRKQLAARPDDAALRIEIARRYFDLAMAQAPEKSIRACLIATALAREMSSPESEVSDVYYATLLH